MALDLLTSVLVLASVVIISVSRRWPLTLFFFLAEVAWVSVCAISGLGAGITLSPPLMFVALAALVISAVEFAVAVTAVLVKT